MDVCFFRRGERIPQGQRMMDPVNGGVFVAVTILGEMGLAKSFQKAFHKPISPPATQQTTSHHNESSKCY
jgi:hypothetical protein